MPQPGVAVAAALMVGWVRLAHAADPAPVPAVDGLLRVFASHQVLALCEGRHAGQQQHDVMERLIRDRRFATTVTDIVVEFGNARYQPVMDRYLGGDDVPRAELQQVWRNTTQPQTLAMEAPVYESFFKTVRDVNRALPADRRIRVWLGDPPIDWAAADVKAAAYLADRDRHFADVVEREIYARGRKALLVSGGRHLARNNTGRNAVALIEARHPGSVFVAEFHDDLGTMNADAERRLATWPRPGFAVIRGTWLGALDPTLRYPTASVMLLGPDGSMQPAPNAYERRKLEDVVDGYVYVGPASALTLSPVPTEEQIDPAFRAELERRRALLAQGRRGRRGVQPPGDAPHPSSAPRHR